MHATTTTLKYKYNIDELLPTVGPFRAIFLFKNHQFSAILNIMIENNDIQYLIVLQVLKKIAGPKMGHLGQKMGQDEVLGHFLGYYALGFGDFAYYD